MADLALYGFRLTAIEVSEPVVRLTVAVFLKADPTTVLGTRTLTAQLKDGRQAIVGQVKREARRLAAAHADESPWWQSQIGVDRDFD
jgi:hypothetical protein